MDTALYILGGLVLLALGGEGVVRGAVSLARRLGVSELVIGLTLVGFGTSTPELITSINAAFAGSPGIALGNVVGSNISNILLIFALVVMLKPVAVNPAAIARDGAVMIIATLALIGVAVGAGTVDFPAGALFVALLLAYIAVAFLAERRGGEAAALHEAEAQETGAAPDGVLVALLFALGGLAMLIVGADLLVDGAIDLARLAGVSETVIGLTIVAVGTSLPELVASLAAALRGRSDVAIGNIIGSNIYNIFGILGITALIVPVPVPADMIWRDWAALLLSAVLLLYHAWTGSRVSRIEGLSLFAVYVLYTWLLVAPPAWLA